MTEPLGIKIAAEALKKEWDAHEVEIRAQEMDDGRQKGVLLLWVEEYSTKRQIYEKYGEGESLYPALYEGWEVRVRKWPPPKKRNKKTRASIAESENSDTAKNN